MVAKLILMEAFLGQLPAGAASYPSCTLKGGAHRVWFDTARLPERSLPDFLETSRHAPATAAIPVAHHNALMLATADLLFASDPRKLAEFTYRVNIQLAQSRWYSALYTMMTPGIIVRATPLAFGRLFTGVKMSVTGVSGAASAKITYPDRLYDRQLADCFASGLQAALVATGSERATCIVQTWTPTQIDLLAEWRHAVSIPPKLSAP